MACALYGLMYRFVTVSYKGIKDQWQHPVYCYYYVKNTWKLTLVGLIALVSFTLKGGK